MNNVADNTTEMEDSHTVHLYLPPGGSTATPDKNIPEQPAGSTVTNDGEPEKGLALAGVFDGHGGSTVAKFTGSTLHTRLANLEAYSLFTRKATLSDAPRNRRLRGRAEAVVPQE
jgi:protein phosphatase 2C family protein 2/3